MKRLLLFFLLWIFIGCNDEKNGFDGLSYKTVKIGNQIWMAENFKSGTEKGSWCYAKKTENCEKYGRLYTWVAAMAFPDSCYNSKCESLKKSPHQGICPNGFHIPTNEEFNELYDYVGGEKAAIELMSRKGTNNKIDSDDEILDEKGIGFNLLLGGLTFNEKEMYDSVGNGSEGHFVGLWSSDNEGVIETTFVWLAKVARGEEEKLKERFDLANVQIISDQSMQVIQGKLFKKGGSYLRCIKD